MSYLVLARKWRPQQFDEILGQEHVTRTLKNAVSSGRIAHAFLFTGARGVGKTSAARILAKALCCERDEGPTATPCGECNACREISDGNATDIFEIDAASNTGVANVREIIENVRYLPSSARFKIYIIDEVHMLSTGAFNALLKTLEEPPSHVKFILATTDVHKIPVTILSRCQRYDFRRIPLVRIASRLSEILTAEQIEHVPSAMTLVARESEGSMRDAQSLLEQVLAYADGRALDLELTRESLGVADRGALGDVVVGIVERQPGRVLELIKEVHDRGLDLKRFGDALVEYVRDLLVAKLVKQPAQLLDRPDDEVKALIERAHSLDSVTLERLFERMCKVVEDVGESAYPRFTLEIGLASLAEQPPRVPLEDLVGQLDRLENTLSTAGGRAAAHNAARGGAARPFRPGLNASPPRSPPPQKTPRPPQDTQFRSGPSEPPASRQASPPRGGPPPHHERRDERPSHERPQDEGPPARQASREGPVQDGPFRSTPPRPSADVAAPEPAPRPVTHAPDPSARFRSTPPPKPAPEPEPERVRQTPPPVAPTGRPAPIDTGRSAQFTNFVDLVRAKRPTLSGSLNLVRPLKFQPGEVELGCETQFDANTLGSDATVKWLQDVLTEHFGAPTTVKITKIEKGQGPATSEQVAKTLDEIEVNARNQRIADKRKKARSAPAVRALREELGAEVDNVRVIEDS